MTTLFKFRKDNTHVLSGYSVEDVRSNRPVVVKENSVIVGDIYAPQVMVQGMVYGYVVAVGVVIDQGGQVWGDICTTAVDMRPGSKIHGWISSMDAGTVDLLRLGQVTLSEIPRSGEYATTNDILTKLEDLVPDLKHESELSKKRIEIFRQLQTAAASAIAARIEIEKTILPPVTGAREEDGSQSQTETITEDRDQESDLNERSMVVDNELSRQLEEAEGEIRQLRQQLMALLDREMEARNQLRWTKLSLERARQRQYESPDEAFAGQSTLVEHVRGRHLAKLLASVVERDIKIQRMKDKIAKREEQLFKLKTLTTTRIKRLESKLSKPNGG